MVSSDKWSTVKNKSTGAKTRGVAAQLRRKARRSIRNWKFSTYSVVIKLDVTLGVHRHGRRGE